MSPFNGATHVAVLDAAHERMKASQRTLDDVRERNRAHAAAGDGRQAAYDVACQMHFDRRAARSRHFGQFYKGGDPDAAHAIEFVKEIDPTGEHGWREPEPLPIKPVQSDVADIVYHRPVNPNGQPATNPMTNPPRGTLTGDMLSAKTPAVRGDQWQVSGADLKRSLARPATSRTVLSDGCGSAGVGLISRGSGLA
jgi:hypothetical protein